METLTRKNNTQVAHNKDVIIVHVDGNVKFDMYGILSKISDGSAFSYALESMKGRSTLIRKKGYTHSHFYHSLMSIIDHVIEDDGWFGNEWKQAFGKEEKASNCSFDTLFYDEFLFLVAENLIEFDSAELLSMDDIWNNFDASTSGRDNPDIASLYGAKTKDELKSEYRKLLIKFHPDKTGLDNAIIRDIITAFNKLNKKYK